MESPYIPYLHLLIMMGIAVVFALAFVLLSKFVGPRKPSAEKLSTYETGIETKGVFLGRFNVKFFLLAILFLLFDLEIVFIYPGAVILKDIAGYRGVVELLIFLGILVVGWAFVIGSGALDWGTSVPYWHKRKR